MMAARVVVVLDALVMSMLLLLIVLLSGSCVKRLVKAGKCTQVKATFCWAG